MDGYGFISLIPVIITIALALTTKNVIFSLFLGVLSGMLILCGGNPVLTMTSMVKDVFVVQLMDSYNAGVIVLLVFIGGFIALMEKSGGAAAFARQVARFLDSRCKAQLAAWIGGIVIFFSDLGTPLIVGPVFEPLFDKFRISREKLAFIIDATAAPVAVLVPFIGWGAYIMGLIQKEYEALNIMESDWDAFVASIPFNIYSIIAVLIVPVIAFTGYEFSAMAKAEKRTLDGTKFWPDAKPMRVSEEKRDDLVTKPMFVWLPILVLLVTMFGILAPQGFPFVKVEGGAFRAALSTAYIAAAAVLILLMVTHRARKFGECFDIYVSGMGRMVSVSVILMLAWSLGYVSDQMGTADFIVSNTVSIVPGWAVPAIAFIFSGILSFATSSSWGTWAILMPIFIPMAYSLGCPLHICIGAMLGGGIFGGHPTPVSDQAILASMGAGCDHIDHIRTQMPIILINGGVSLIAYVIAGVTHSLIALLAGIALSWIIMIVVSKIRGVKIKNYKIDEVEAMDSAAEAS